MASIRYIGKAADVRIPGIGLVGKDWTPGPEEIIEQFKDDPGFEVYMERGIRDAGIHADTVGSVQKESVQKGGKTK
jgi:hypothetical protein